MKTKSTTSNTIKRLSCVACTALLCGNIVSCATNNSNSKTSTNPQSQSSSDNQSDPYEKINRKIYAFNFALDKVFIRPVAKSYDFIMPNVAQKGVLHFFSNIGEIPNIANDILQADAPWALTDTWRFIINSTVGIVGLFDVATPLGLPKHVQDFGLTLARWGAKDTPYLMLPFFGPYTIRDAAGLPINIIFAPTSYISPTAAYVAIKGLYVTSARANLLPADRVLDDAFDPYIFVRNAYLQKRDERINRLMQHENKPTSTDANTASATSATKSSSNNNDSSNYEPLGD